ncbi:integrase-type DNA-binding superfamily protein, partial [Striga asiatica]
QKIRVSFAESSSEESDAAASAGSKRKTHGVVVRRKKSKPKEKSPPGLRIRLKMKPNSPEKELLPLGVQRRKRGKYASEIKNPLTKKRIWLGTFATADEAGAAYLAKKEEFEEKLRAKQARDCARRGKKLANRESPTSVLKVVAAEGGISGGEAAAEFGFFRGVRVLDENGCLLGEFRRLDDLSILADENGVILAR